jgi:transposase-like protein
MSDPEVPANPKRRQFTAQYKLAIVEQADACTGYGEVAALLRREGLFDSQLSSWRKQRASGALTALAGKKRGRPQQPVNPLAQRVLELERKNARLQQQLQKAEMLIDVQKKISEILGIAQPTQPLGEDD